MSAGARALLAVTALAAAACAAGAQRPTPAPAAPRASGGAIATQLGVTVAPDTVAVGDPFLVRVRVRAPRGAVVEFPLGPDSASQVELIDPRRVVTAPDSTAVDVTAEYRAAAWDVGARPLGLGDAVVRVGAQVRRVPLGNVRVFVASVLPADTAAARDPKPPRALFEPEIPWWRKWLPWLIAAALAALLLAWLWRRLRRRRPATGVDAFAEAEAGFARVDALGLLEAGERGRYVTLVVEVLRDYLARRVPEAATSLTTTELITAMSPSGAVPVPRLAPLLAEADLVKFARHPITADRARELARSARLVVRETEDETRRRDEERLAAERAAQRAVQVTTKRPVDSPGKAA